MGRPHELVEALEALDPKAFVCDTAPVIYRLERGATPVLTRVCDRLFDTVESGALACYVSTVTVAEVLIGGFRVGPAGVSLADRFLLQPALGVVEVSAAVARGAAELVARGRIGRLADALIAATALELGLPLVTGDRRIARAAVVETYLVADFAG